MKILWLCNIMLPAYAKAHGLPFSSREGWLTGCLNRITKEEDSRDLELGICFPSREEMAIFGEVVDGVTYYAFSEDLDHPEIYDEGLENSFREILDDFKPDVVHVFGTEFPHSLAMLRVFDNPQKALLGIQGLCGEIAKEYMADIPEDIRNMVTFRDRVKGDSLIQQQEKYSLRAENEKKAIKLTGNIAGRTAFDKEKTKEINPDAVYFQLNETLRQSFYEDKWNETEAEPHSIFLPQGDYPLKGFHFVLQAMPEILQKYPDAQLYVAGNNIIGKSGNRYPYFLRASAYGKYIKRLISKYRLKKKVTMLGMLDEAAMKERLLKSSVFVCASAVETSPNSVGEAMLLGMPVAVSRAGGIPSIVTENRDGVFFEKGDSHKLAEAVMQLWDEPVIASVYGENASRHARMTHDPDANYRRLLEIYHTILNERQ